MKRFFLVVLACFSLVSWQAVLPEESAIERQAREAGLLGGKPKKFIRRLFDGDRSAQRLAAKVLIGALLASGGFYAVYNHLKASPEQQPNRPDAVVPVSKNEKPAPAGGHDDNQVPDVPLVAEPVPTGSGQQAPQNSTPTFTPVIEGPALMGDGDDNQVPDVPLVAEPALTGSGQQAPQNRTPAFTPAIEGPALMGGGQQVAQNSFPAPAGENKIPALPIVKAQGQQAAQPGTVPPPLPEPGVSLRPGVAPVFSGAADLIAQVKNHVIQSGRESVKDFRYLNGDTFLGRAFRHGHNHAIMFLLNSDFGIDVNAPINADGDTPLCAAFGRYDVDMAKRLIARGADVQKRNKNGYGPQHFIAAKARPWWGDLQTLLEVRPAPLVDPMDAAASASHQKQAEDISALVRGDEQCAVCQRSQGPRESWRVTRCGHAFHEQCLEELSSLAGSPSCPVCHRAGGAMECIPDEELLALMDEARKIRMPFLEFVQLKWEALQRDGGRAHGGAGGPSPAFAWQDDEDRNSPSSWVLEQGQAAASGTSRGVPHGPSYNRRVSDALGLYGASGSDEED